MIALFYSGLLLFVIVIVFFSSQLGAASRITPAALLQLLHYVRKTKEVAHVQ